MPEVGWRLQQKLIQEKEKSEFGGKNVSIKSRLYNNSLDKLVFNPAQLGINFENSNYETKTSIHLLGGFSYEQYRDKWNAGFQTNHVWDNEFSYSLKYKQRDDIGDARTNWELNRHFQFALLAKAYYVTGDKKYFDELNHLFYDWNDKNPFLHGISWTSVMEIAIRCIQWCITLAFLSQREELKGERILKDLEVGIKNMAWYTVEHHSRFSSANNHLLVEATAIGFAGFAFGYEPWKQLSIRILDEELLKQNFEDGVNKEMSLHYQTFGMEAYALVMHLMGCSGLVIPDRWKIMLEKQCEFVVCSMVSETQACEFGDNDEGKILDLEGGEISHYRYVLQLCSLVLGKRFERLEHISETISWLFAKEQVDKVNNENLYVATISRTFPLGGYTFLRSNDGRIVIGIDHAPLGFGSIAAHGHADALSFQLYIDGQCVLGDPGTYIYHCYLNKRNDYRRSCNHNTVCITGEEQSQMLGAFLWGKKAMTSLDNSSLDGKEESVSGTSIWQNGIIHSRRFKFDKTSLLTITDKVPSNHNFVSSLVIHPDCEIEKETSKNFCVKVGNIVIHIYGDSEYLIKNVNYSTQYGIERQAKKIEYPLNDNLQTTKIWIEKY
jgi:hypothetical protein